MTKRFLELHTHNEPRDISHAYAIYLGTFSNVVFHCYDIDGEEIGSFGTPYEMVKFDGRLPHLLERDELVGKRYCLIIFKSYDHRLISPSPIFQSPVVIEKVCFFL